MSRATSVLAKESEEVPSGRETKRFKKTKDNTTKAMFVSSNHVVPQRSRIDVPFDIVIEIDSSSLVSFAFYATYYLSERRKVLKREDVVTWRVTASPRENMSAPRVYWSPIEDGKCSNHELVTDTTLTSLAWACNHTSFYGKRRGRLFCEHMESLAPEGDFVYRKEHSGQRILVRQYANTSDIVRTPRSSAPT